MKVIDLLSLIKGECCITFYEFGEDSPMCYTKNTWGGIVPYYQREIVQIEMSDDLRACKTELIIHMAKAEVGEI